MYFPSPLPMRKTICIGKLKLCSNFLKYINDQEVKISLNCSSPGNTFNTTAVKNTTSAILAFTNGNDSFPLGR